VREQCKDGVNKDGFGLRRDSCPDLREAGEKHFLFQKRK
jgi:hypothetical protein